MARIRIDQLDTEVKKILDEYQEQIISGARATTRAVAETGAAAVRANARAAFNGKKYAAGWTYKLFDRRLYTEAVIHNKTEYRLAHLLEHGHAIKIGGRFLDHRYPGVEHIKPVEEEINQRFEQKLRAII